VEILYSAGKQT